MFYSDLGRIQNKLPKGKGIRVHFFRYYSLPLMDLLSTPLHSALCPRRLTAMDCVSWFLGPRIKVGLEQWVALAGDGRGIRRQKGWATHRPAPLLPDFGFA